MSRKEDFYKYQAQTTPYASGFQVSHAKGNYIYGKDGKAYLDFEAGVSANTLGHSHPRILKALEDQMKQYLHVMVYGEYVQDAPLKLCQLLAENTPIPLESTYLVNSGTEAVEGAIKLAKRYTGRHQMVAFQNAYHGNTQGTMSVCGNEDHKRSFRPLIPGTRFIKFNDEEDFSHINEQTAGVIVETIQGANGFIVPQKGYLKALKNRCEEVGALLILDEVQPGFGRTGKLFGFMQEEMVPDILVMGKGMAGGMPIGAFMSSKEIMKSLETQPLLGHITTFGGHPMPAAAGVAVLEELLETDLMQQVDEKEALFRKLLVHPKIKTINGRGLMLALELESPEFTQKIAQSAMEKGLILFWLLYKTEFLRLSPPLTITKEEIEKGCGIILECLDLDY